MNITQETLNKIKVDKYFILYFDILGYKENLKRYGEEKCLRPIYLGINFAIKDYIEWINNVQFALATKIKIHYRVFSDNILVAIKRSKNELENIYALYCLSKFVMNIQLTLAIEFGIFIRGCFHYGNLFFDKTILYGNGLIEAVTYEEKIAVYPRLILTTELKDYINNCILTNLSNKYIFSQISKMPLEKLKTDVLFGKNKEMFYTAPNTTFDFVMKWFNNDTTITANTKIGKVLNLGHKEINEEILKLYKLSYNTFLSDLTDHWYKLEDNCYFLNYLSAYLTCTYLTKDELQEKHLKIVQDNIQENIDLERVKAKYEWVLKYHYSFFNSVD